MQNKDEYYTTDFQKGDRVFWKEDKEQKVPMTVEMIDLDNDIITCKYMHSNGTFITETFSSQSLTY